MNKKINKKEIHRILAAKVGEHIIILPPLIKDVPRPNIIRLFARSIFHPRRFSNENANKYIKIKKQANRILEYYHLL